MSLSVVNSMNAVDLRTVYGSPNDSRCSYTTSVDYHQPMPTRKNPEYRLLFESVNAAIIT